MSYFPFFFDLTKFHCLVIGGGEIALNKVRLLSQYQANITVVALEIKEEIIHTLKHNGSSSKSNYHQRAFHTNDLHNADIIIIATNDDEFNTQTWKLAKEHHKIVNVVDDREKCDFIFPALVNRGDLTVAISTSGVAPSIASWLRSKFETELPQTWTTIMQSLKKQQPSIRQALPDTRYRRRFYRSLIDDVLPYFLRPSQRYGKENAQSDQYNHSQHSTETMIDQRINEQLNQSQKNKELSSIKKAKVYLVGAGPGDPELLTLRAQQALQQADIVLYDRLLNNDLLDYTRRDAEKIFVGKKANNHTKSQQQIHQLLIAYAQKGNIVVRLKGGDPFIFGRGGEEMYELEKQGIDVEIIPGVSAVNGIAANLGIPLTLRGVSDKLLLTSIYSDQKHEVNWQQLSLPKQTIALYMSLQKISQISTQLIAHGLDENTPIALIEKGTFRQQKSIYTTLKQTQSPQFIQEIELKSPVLSIIGEVIKHCKQSKY